jgi:2-polyprenyl-3-methyl-5-hydroxy-6-metoxy-1,4-benzoquinol methylase
MNEHINYICQRIEVLSPMHCKKLKKNMRFFDSRYNELADTFFGKYVQILAAENKTLDYSIDCYLQMIADVNTEALEFLRTGKYTSSTFDEVNSRVYARPETMEYYMHGLLLSQFLWKHHYEMFDYFTSTLPRYADHIKSYLEAGVGHGFYLSRALEILGDNATLTAVDISETSIELAKRFINDSRITYNLKNVFDFNNGEKYDFITLGEVLEHVEDPLGLLVKLNTLLSGDGVLFFTTPTNAPAIDHIYLFNNVEEIRDIVRSADFKIASEMSFLSEDVSAEKAEKYKVAVLYGAFLKKI